MQNALSRSVKAFSFLIFISAFLVTQGVVAQNDPQLKIGENSLSIKSGDQTRQYLLYIPSGNEGKAPLPLVLLFHGHGGTSKGVMELTGLSNVADKKNFIIAAPEGIKKIWNTGFEPGGVNDVEFVKDLIREISSKVAIDKKRIYAAGFSLGAKMCSRLACDLSNDIAAIGAVAGFYFPAKCDPTRPVSVITFYGTADRYDSGTEVFISTWAENYGCNKTPMTKNISTNVTQNIYTGCNGKSEVALFRINDGGHVWPDSPIAERLENAGIWEKGKTNKDINATNLIWSFFEAHPMP